MQSITVQQLADQNAESPVELIDVRTRAEFSQRHAAPARNIPLDELDPRSMMSDRALRHKDRPVYLICKSGVRSSEAVQRLTDAGYGNLIHVIGGTDAWQAANLPMAENRLVVSLERQVRIAAGILTLFGILLSLLIHPYCIIVALLTGAGLVFDGVTETCGIRVLLGKMPWNRFPSR